MIQNKYQLQYEHALEHYNNMLALLRYIKDHGTLDQYDDAIERMNKANKEVMRLLRWHGRKISR